MNIDFIKRLNSLILVLIIGFLTPLISNAQTGFSPTVSISLSNTDCNSLADLTVSVSQDAGEVDMLSSLFTSSSGSFDIANMNVGEIIGSALLSANNGANTFNAELTVTAIVSTSEVIVQSTDVNTGLVLGNFNILNTNPGVSISATTLSLIHI